MTDVFHLPDGTYDVVASEKGGGTEFLINFDTREEAEAWIEKVKSSPIESDGDGSE